MSFFGGRPNGDHTREIRCPWNEAVNQTAVCCQKAIKLLTVTNHCAKKGTLTGPCHEIVRVGAVESEAEYEDITYKPASGRMNTRGLMGERNKRTY
jgi:hypothetical protein